MIKYFDYAATSLPCDFIIKDVLKTYSSQELFGNPSSIHDYGIGAKHILEKSRKIIAKQLKCSTKDIIFTSGGTESDNMALDGIMLRYNPDEAELIVSSIEHPAILKTCEYLNSLGYVIHYVNVNRDGIIDLDELESYINKKTKLISIMAVNNEIGTIQPIEEISKIARSNKILFHTDAVQTVGLYNFDIKLVDMASFSGHKFGALKGTGLLYKKSNIKLQPIINGGGQEEGLRSGTENVFGNIIMALSLAYTRHMWDENLDLIKSGRDYLGTSLKVEFNDNVIINGSYYDKRICNNLNVSFKNIDGDTLALLLSQEGYKISVGSACHSNSTDISNTIKSIMVPENFQKGTIRITIPYCASSQDIIDFAHCLIEKTNYLYERGI